MQDQLTWCLPDISCPSCFALTLEGLTVREGKINCFGLAMVDGVCLGECLWCNRSCTCIIVFTVEPWYKNYLWAEVFILRWSLYWGADAWTSGTPAGVHVHVFFFGPPSQWSRGRGILNYPLSVWTEFPFRLNKKIWIGYNEIDLHKKLVL